MERNPYGNAIVLVARACIGKEATCARNHSNDFEIIEGAAIKLEHDQGPLLPIHQWATNELRETLVNWSLPETA